MNFLHSPAKPASLLSPMKFFRLFILLLTLPASLAIHAQIPTVPVSELVPTKSQEETTKIITEYIARYHYKNKKIDDKLSSSILDRYLDSLDPNRSYFMAQDIQSFEKYRDKLDDALIDDKLDAPFQIFRVYRQRVSERVDYAIKLLDTKFSFDVDENYMFDRKDQPWPANQQDMDELWRKRVKNDLLSLKLSGKKDTDYRDTLRKRYERIRTSTEQLNSNDIYQTFINAYTTSIEPHTAYFSPRASENFDISMRLSLEGIGAVLTTDNDYTKIQHIIPGGPADLSKQIKDNDLIVGVGQGETGEIIDVVGWRLDDVVDLIRGPKDTIVRLEIIPANSGPEAPNKIITLTRNKIKLEEQAAKSSVIDIPGTDRKVGVIDVPTFYVDFAAQARGDKNYRSTSRDVRKLLADLSKQNLEGIIIDLRENGGGSLTEALELTGLFIKEGPIVQTKDSTGRVEIDKDPDPRIIYSGPMAVLVDRNSASASEIFAGAIQDYQRGLIIGEPTFGKGTVQNIVDINRWFKGSDADHGRLKTTIAQFFRISGSSNQFKGVIPDIEFPTVDDAGKYGERSLDNALPWEQVKPAKYYKVKAPLDKYDLVRQMFKQRIAHEKAFQLLMKEVKLINETNKSKSVSLMESKRIKERDQLLQAKRDLENEIRVAQGLPPLKGDLTDQDNNAEEEDKKTDILLNEAAYILDDLIKVSNQGQSGLKAAQRTSASADDNNL